MRENYYQILKSKRKEAIDTKNDVSIGEAFELYMLKKFHNIELSPLSSKILDFWQKDFDQSISKHLKFLKDNIEDQNVYASRFSEILQNMDIFKMRMKIKSRIKRKNKIIPQILINITKMKIKKILRMTSKRIIIRN